MLISCDPILRRWGYRVFEISTASHEGLKPLIFAMANLVEEDRQKRASENDKPVADAPVVRPKGFRSRKKQEFIIRREERNLEPLFRVIGEKPERWIQQTDFNNDEAVGYLADRLAKLGVEDELFKSGARAGDAVVIGEDDNSVVFDWEPTMVGGAELLSSPRVPILASKRLFVPPARRNVRNIKNAWMRKLRPAPSLSRNVSRACGPSLWNTVKS